MGIFQCWALLCGLSVWLHFGKVEPFPLRAKMQRQAGVLGFYLVSTQSSPLSHQHQLLSCAGAGWAHLCIRHKVSHLKPQTEQPTKFSIYQNMCSTGKYHPPCKSHAGGTGDKSQQRRSGECQCSGTFSWTFLFVYLSVEQSVASENKQENHRTTEVGKGLWDQVQPLSSHHLVS